MYTRIIQTSIISLVLILPFTVSASIRFNEVAWMGTSTSPNDEWIELYNDSEESINLEGWSIFSSDGSPTISLTGTIQSNGYYLLERTDDTTVPDVTSDILFTGALTNTGEELQLQDLSGSVVDIVGSIDNGWEAGSSNPLYTMSFVGSGWVNGESTPRAGNVGVSSESDDSENVEENTEENDEDDLEEDIEESISTTSTESSRQVVKPPRRGPLTKMTLDMPRIGIADDAMKFTVFAHDGKAARIGYGRYLVNMGDGTVYTFSHKTTFTHVYDFPGEYVIVISFWETKDLPDVEPKAYVEKIFKVVDNPLEVIAMQGGIEIKNASKETIDISLWKISNGNVLFTIPEKTLIKGKASLVLSSRKSGVWGNSVEIYSSEGRPLTSSTKQENQTVSVDTLGAGISSVEVAEDIKDTTMLAQVKRPLLRKSVLPMLLFFGILSLGIGLILFIKTKREEKDGYVVKIIEEE